MKEINTIIQGIDETATTIKDLISKNKIALTFAIVWSMLFIYKLGHALGEFIYYVGQS